MKKRLPKKLSSIPSVAIRQAVQDLNACERDEKYVINMGDWHAPALFHTLCSVCFAGSVIAKRLGANLNHDKIPCDMGPHQTTLLALNAIREGYVPSCWSRHVLSCEETEIMESASMNWLSNHSYYDDHGRFKRSLLRVADMFERRGH